MLPLKVVVTDDKWQLDVAPDVTPYHGKGHCHAVPVWSPEPLRKRRKSPNQFGKVQVLNLFCNQCYSLNFTLDSA